MFLLHVCIIHKRCPRWCKRKAWQIPLHHVQ